MMYLCPNCLSEIDVLMGCCGHADVAMTDKTRRRAREWGFQFSGDTGALNSIQDVPGVGVGYSTLSVPGVKQTGVTAIIPRKFDISSPCAAATFSLNGNGEMTGRTWIEECGAFSGPICITSTSAVGVVHRAVIDWLNDKHADTGSEWLLPVVAETYDGYLTNLNGPCHIAPENAFAALDEAVASSEGPARCIEEGSVGGGTGMNSFGFKAGSGTSSRVISHGSSQYSLGVFVQANFGLRSELTINGVVVGRHLLEDNPLASFFHPSDSSSSVGPSLVPSEGSGSVIVIVATDAPLLPLQLKAIARRVSLGIARTGSACSHFSGDIFLAFSTANQGGALSSSFSGKATDDDYESLRFIPWGHMDKFFTATVQAAEEAVVNALCAADETIGYQNRRIPGLPIERVVDIVLNNNHRLKKEDY